MSDKTLCFTVPDNLDNISVKTFLRRNCGVSARMISRLKREKNGILRDNKNLKTIDILHKGDIIILNLPDEENTVVPVKGDLVIVYEDEYLIVINKPYGVPVHPTKVHQEDTLANFLSYLQAERGENYTFRAINRLDKDTSGLVVIAKDKYCASNLFNTLDKTYYAVCEGIIEGKGRIDKPIRLKDGHSIQRTCADDGLKSVTNYEALKSFNNHTLLKIKLETGHTHQIRVHFSYSGHPLAGDDMYGASLKYIKRQALHCGEVSFIHPVTKDQISLKSDLPEDIKKLTLS